MNSIINQLTSLISSSKDKSLNKQLLSIKKRVERIETKEREKLRRQVHRALENRNPIETRESSKEGVRKFRVKNIGHKTIEKFLKAVRKKVLRKLEPFPTKDQYILTITMQKPNGKEMETRQHHIRTSFSLNENEEDRESQYDSLNEFFNKKVEEAKYEILGIFYEEELSLVKE